MNDLKLFAKGWNDYELIDAGGNKKLERWGKIVTIRPERQAYFQSGLSFKEWNEIAHWEFVDKNNTSGTWKALKPNSPDAWNITFQGCVFELRLTKFKHIGVFPEQNINWKKISSFLYEEAKMLNLFAYTGGASLIGKKKGADVYHIDAVKQLIRWAKTNQELSELDNIRWVLEDALKFSQREVKRGNQYDLIIMDPPAWGIGAKNEKWKIENKLDELIGNASTLLRSNGQLILNTYSPKVEVLDLLQFAKKHFIESNFSVHELWMTSSTQKELYFGNILYAKK